MTEHGHPNPVNDGGGNEALEIRLNRMIGATGSPSIAVAESCTGGNVARRITSVPGSSAYFSGGVVAYANTVKESVLHVPHTILGTQGAVSAECAEAMADGVRNLLSSDIAVSTTGIAGPDGGSAAKPVGLVYLAISSAGATTSERRIFSGDRGQIIDAASERALELVLNAVHEIASNIPGQTRQRSDKE